MELVEEKIEHFAAEKEEHDHCHCHCHDVEKIFNALDIILRQLNTENYDPSEEELDQLRAKVEQYADKLEKIME
jgi:hypothetical protein